MIVGDLFSGIGGFSLAAHWMGWRTAWFSEIDPYASSVLAHHWPDVPNLGDIRTIDWATVEPVDVLTGGFPCQPHSLAGKRQGSNDERDLFDEIIRCAGVLRPRVLVLENVPGLFTSDAGRFFGRVLGAVAALGYDAEWRVLSAADVGAPHRRERVWIVAHARRDEQSAGRGHAGKVRCIPTPQREPENGPAVSGGSGDQLGNADDVAHAQPQRLQGRDDPRGVQDVGVSRHEPAGSGGDVEHAASGGWRAGRGVEVRRVVGGCAGLGHAKVSGLEGHAGHGDDGHEPGRFTERASGPTAAPSVPVGWSDAVPARGADNTVRLIPREAAEGGPESALWPVAHGVSGRVARLRGIGNSIVPQCALEIFRSIAERDAMTVAA